MVDPLTPNIQGLSDPNSGVLLLTCDFAMAPRRELTDLAKCRRRSTSCLAETSCSALTSSCSVVQGWSTSEQGGKGRDVRGDQEDAGLRVVHEAQPLELVYRGGEEDHCQASWYVVPPVYAPFTAEACIKITSHQSSSRIAIPACLISSSGRTSFIPMCETRCLLLRTRDSK